MGDTGGELTDGGHLLGLDELAFQPLAVGDIDVDALDGFLPAMLDGAKMDRDRHHTATPGNEAEVFAAQVAVAVGSLAQLA